MKHFFLFFNRNLKLSLHDRIKNILRIRNLLGGIILLLTLKSKIQGISVKISKELRRVLKLKMTDYHIRIKREKL